VGFDRNLGSSLGKAYVDGLRSVLDALPSAVRRLTYISSTGVFGQTDGGWVDEGSVCQPTRSTGQACLDAEQVLQRHPLGPRSIILRLAGIYGPQRVPWGTDVLEGRPIAADPQGHLNLIHVDDAARVVLAADDSVAAPRMYLVSDGHPVTRGEYCRHLARCMHAPAVRFTRTESGQSAAPRGATNKRICNDRMLRELKVTLQYPTYGEGLAPIAVGCGQLPNGSDRDRP
jgi:nucleoside-diphosphate-sugar epimerase